MARDDAITARDAIMARDDAGFARRTLIAAGTAGITAGLAGCDRGSVGTEPFPSGQPGSPTPYSVPSPAPSSSPSPSPSTSRAPAAGGLARTSDIPVGSGKIFHAYQVVVTQPTAGTFKAFSDVCTHQGCQVEEISNGRIRCPCHNSQYSIVDGSVQSGPAPRALPARALTVKDGELFLS